MLSAARWASRGFVSENAIWSRLVSTGTLTDNPDCSADWERSTDLVAIDSTACDEMIPFSVAMITGCWLLALADSPKTTTVACAV